MTRTEHLIAIVAEECAEVAQRVMGWKRPAGCWWWYVDHREVADGEWNPLERANDAFEVIDALESRDLYLGLTRDEDGWHAAFRRKGTLGDKSDVCDKDPLRAICLAALKAVE